MSVQLRPMRDDEVVEWLPQMRDAYADDMVEFGGMSPESAAAKAAGDTERLLTGGRLPADHVIFAIEADGETVGDLWLAERDDTLERSLFVYVIHIAEAHRGRGYGKEAMLFAEDEARRRGFDRIALNVFGGNSVARNLYRSLGYTENAVSMSKQL